MRNIHYRIALVILSFHLLASIIECQESNKHGVMKYGTNKRFTYFEDKNAVEKSKISSRSLRGDGMYSFYYSRYESSGDFPVHAVIIPVALICVFGIPFSCCLCKLCCK